MKILFLGGVFDDSHIEEITAKTKTYVEHPANNFQKKILKGLEECSVKPEVVSAPFLGAYPTAYSDMVFRGFDKSVKDDSGYAYVHFNNIWGLRNPSRARALKKAVKRFALDRSDEKLIIVYTPHTPLIEAANYAKSIDNSIRICMIVPDLPQYMNLSDNISLLYRVFKRYDVKSFMRESKAVDSFVLLTEQMKEPLEVGDRPYMVTEGIYEAAAPFEQKNNKNTTTIVYTGKLNRSFGVVDLLDAFCAIDDPSLRLVICGSGDDRDAVTEYACRDGRIDYRGQVSPEEAAACARQGDILVNPRRNDSEYTKYSFPSKIIDYLSYGKPVIAYRLDGMPKAYEDYIWFVPENGHDSLKDTLIMVMNLSEREKAEKSRAAIEYLEQHLSCRNIAADILRMNHPDAAD